MGRPNLKTATLIVTTVSGFLTPFMSAAVNIALPAIGREFSFSALLLSWTATSYVLAAAVFLVPFGRIADIVGRKKIFLYGTVVYTAASLFLALTRSGWALIGGRVIQGIGGAMVFATGVAILTSVYPPGERGRVLGINVAAVYSGLALGPVLGGFLTDHLGWRSIFWVNVLLGLVIIGLVLWQLKAEWRESGGGGFDLLGSVIYGLSLVLVMYGLSRLPRGTGFGLLACGLAGLVGFVFRELQIPSPVLDMNLFRRNAVFAFSNLAALINYSATSATGFLLSLYLQYVKVLSAQEAGMILIAQPLVQAVFSPLAGRLSDRLEPRLIASSGMGLSVIGLAALTLVGDKTPVGLIVVGLVLLGLGFGLFSSPNTNAIMGSVERRHYGVASATLGTMRLVGMMLSMGITMLLFSIYIGPAKIGPENHLRFLTALKVGFSIFALLSIVGIFASLARGRMRANEAGTD